MKLRLSLAVGVVVLLSAGIAACSSGGGSPSAGSSGNDSGKTLSVVYVPGAMPYIGVSNGALTGVEGELFNQAANQLGTKTDAHPAEFAAFLAGVQNGRYDIGVGGVAWTKERAATGLFTDPIYYSPVVVMCKPGLHPNKPEELKGFSVGTAASSIQDIGFRGIDGVQVHTYPSLPNTVQDLISGRLDCVALDTLQVSYIKNQRSDLNNYDITTLQSPSADEIKANPALANFLPYMVAWYLPKKNSQLVDQLNTVIRSWYASGFTAKTLTKWGVSDPKSFLTPNPSFDTDRRSVDRPSTWNAPAASA